MLDEQQQSLREDRATLPTMNLERNIVRHRGIAILVE
jgi:hypothetical protein